jgi:hypothetical protein
MPKDDLFWEAFSKYVYLTPTQVQLVTGRKQITVYVRLERFYDAGLLGKARQNDFSPWLYFLTEKGALKCIERGYLTRKWYIGRKATNQIPHEIGITNCQMIFAANFPGEIRRWRADLQKDFHGEVPDLFFNLDGTWTPFEYVLQNPLTIDKLRDYNATFPRSYFILPTEKRVENVLAQCVHENLDTTKLWFTTETLFKQNPTGKIWATPHNYEDRAYSILKPES